MADPKKAGERSKKIVMEPGTYFWCACGESNNQPFCDSSHRGTEFTPILTKIEEKKEVAWCMCKYSENKPFCDGRHREL
jgi:CDGSH-type Zn-finger protein